MSSGPVLLLTRPSPQSEQFLHLCETRVGRKLPAVISPVLKIEAKGANWDLDAATIVVTSGNAVHVLRKHLPARQVATVGEATAALARSFGADATCLGENAEALLDRAKELVPPVVLARGVHARMDLAKELRARGVEARAVTVYDQVAMPLSAEAKQLLSGAQPIVAPVFSPRSAGLLAAHPINAPLTVLAISEAVRDAWTRPGDVSIAKRPTAEAMCDLVAELL